MAGLMGTRIIQMTVSMMEIPMEIPMELLMDQLLEILMGPTTAGLMVDSTEMLSVRLLVR